MDPNSRSTRSSSGPDDHAALLEELCFWRAIYPLRGTDDAAGVMTIDRAVFHAEHRFEVLRIQDLYLRRPFIPRRQSSPHRIEE